MSVENAPESPYPPVLEEPAPIFEQGDAQTPAESELSADQELYPDQLTP